MSEDEILDVVRGRYKEGGFPALSFSALKADGRLYWALYKKGITQAVMLEQLQLAEDYAAWKAAQPIVRKGRSVDRWTWERIVREAREVLDAEGFLPPAGWFQAHGRGTLVASVYYLDKTWEDVRVEVGGFTTSAFVESRNGLRWRSHAEASLSNFLHARGVPHARGRRYPEDYERVTGRSYGMYDLHFESAGRAFDVEVWGDNPGGHGAEAYQVKRGGKEAFNADNPGFIGLNHTDCYSDDRLTELLAPFIGFIEPFQFDKPRDEIIQSTHWSNVDELLIHCADLASKQPDGKFPSEDWLRKRGKCAERPGAAYNTLSVYIKLWIGGIRPLRELLDQPEHSTTRWTKEGVIAAYGQFWNVHGHTPGQVRALAQRHGVKFEPAVLKEAGRLVSAVNKYAGGAPAVHEALGIPVSRSAALHRRWTARKAG